MSDAEVIKIERPLTPRQYKRQENRVLQAYIGEVEHYRREVKALIEQVNGLAAIVSEFFKKP